MRLLWSFSCLRGWLSLCQLLQRQLVPPPPSSKVTISFHEQYVIFPFIPKKPCMLVGFLPFHTDLLLSLTIHAFHNVKACLQAQNTLIPYYNYENLVYGFIPFHRISGELIPCSLKSSTLGRQWEIINVEWKNCYLFSSKNYPKRSRGRWSLAICISLLTEGI